MDSDDSELSKFYLLLFNTSFDSESNATTEPSMWLRDSEDTVGSGSIWQLHNSQRRWY